jgi:hypothetical protein
MKEHPILFPVPMVLAILEGRKTQTRRIVKFNDAGRVKHGKKNWHPDDPNALLACPHGQIGNYLWVKETFFAFGRWETQFSKKKGRDEWHFVDVTLETERQYQYDAPESYKPKYRSSVTPEWWKRPSLFMPRVASRILLERFFAVSSG